MRYTTIIDLSELPLLYRSANVRLVYLHLVLQSGYHNADKDLCYLSIRRLAQETGVSVSACRHALHMLTNAGLLEKRGNALWVKKWLAEGSYATRPKQQRDDSLRAAQQAREAQEQQREQEMAAESRRRAQLERDGDTAFIEMYETYAAAVKAGTATMVQASMVRAQRQRYEQEKAKVLKRQRA